MSLNPSRYLETKPNPNLNCHHIQTPTNCHVIITKPLYKLPKIHTTFCFTLTTITTNGGCCFFILSPPPSPHLIPQNPNPPINPQIHHLLQTHLQNPQHPSSRIRNPNSNPPVPPLLHQERRWLSVL